MGLVALVIAGCIWLPCLHFVFDKSASDFYRPEGLSSQARQLAARHIELWTEPQSRERELQKMRVSNAEWDFMGRTKKTTAGTDRRTARRSGPALRTGPPFLAMKGQGGA